MNITYIHHQPTCGLPRCHRHQASHAVFTFDINPDEVFRRTCNRSLVIAKRSNITDPNMVFGKDSVDFFNDWFDVALSDLLLTFGRWQRVEDILSFDGKIYDTEHQEVEFNAWLQDTDTGIYQISVISTRFQDTNMYSALSIYATDFLVRRILEEFYAIDLGSSSALQRIIDTLNYQKDKVKIKTSPF